MRRERETLICFKIIIKNVCRMPKQGQHSRSTVVGFRVAILYSPKPVFFILPWNHNSWKCWGQISVWPIWKRCFYVSFFFHSLFRHRHQRWDCILLFENDDNWVATKKRGKPFNLGNRHTGEYQKENWVYEKLHVHRAALVLGGGDIWLFVEGFGSRKCGV